MLVKPKVELKMDDLLKRVSMHFEVVVVCSVSLLLFVTSAQITYVHHLIIIKKSATSIAGGAKGLPLSDLLGS